MLSQDVGTSGVSHSLFSTQEQRVLLPGTLLRSNRYRLREQAGRQEWHGGVYEAMWIAQDAQRSGSLVMLCELMTPEAGSMMIQSFLRTATMALTSVGRHRRVPTLWDAFSEQGRNFFVFEPVEGDSLLSHMRRTGRALPEQEVIDCCLQMIDILELLAQQSPPLIHGLINPEHIVKGRFSGEYVLTNFSVVLAGGATQFVIGMGHAHMTPYMSPDLSRGVIDLRADLYSLLATAYHAVTGSVPSGAGNNDIVPQAQQLNPTVSPSFNAILARGLHPDISQRYQSPSELRQELLSMLSGPVSNPGMYMQGSQPLAGEPQKRVQMPEMRVPGSASEDVSRVLPHMMSSSIGEEEQEQRLLLPRPEELPPMKTGNDMRRAIWWVVGILLCLIIIVLLSRGFL